MQSDCREGCLSIKNLLEQVGFSKPVFATRQLVEGAACLLEIRPVHCLSLRDTLAVNTSSVGAVYNRICSIRLVDQWLVLKRYFERLGDQAEVSLGFLLLCKFSITRRDVSRSSLLMWSWFDLVQLLIGPASSEGVEVGNDAPLEHRRDCQVLFKISIWEEI